MTLLEVSMILLAIFVITCTAYWIDAKYQWRLVDWLNGKCSNPFTNSTIEANSTLAASQSEKDKEIATLKSRIEVLEAIVTEPKYELRKSIDALK